MSPSFHKSLNVLKVPLNTDIHTFTVGWKVQCTWVSRRRKSISQFKKTIMRQSCQKKKWEGKEKEHKMWINNVIYVAVLSCAYCVVIMIIVCLLFVRPVADLLTDRVSVSVYVHSAWAFYLSNEILRMRALASPRFRFQASASKCADLSRFGLKQNNSRLTHTRTHTHTLICIISKDAEQNCGRHACWAGPAKNILKSHSPRRQADAFLKILICICICISLKLTLAWHVNTLPAGKEIPRQRCNLWVACLLNQSSYLLLQNKFVLELKHTSSYSFMLISRWLTVANVVQRATWFEFWYIKIHFLPLPWELSLSYCIRISDGSSTKGNSSLLLLLHLLLQLCFYSQLVVFG